MHYDTLVVEPTRQGAKDWYRGETQRCYHAITKRIILSSTASKCNVSKDQRTKIILHRALRKLTGFLHLLMAWLWQESGADDLATQTALAIPDNDHQSRRYSCRSPNCPRFTHAPHGNMQLHCPHRTAIKHSCINIT